MALKHVSEYFKRPFAERDNQDAQEKLSLMNTASADWLSHLRYLVK